MGVERAAREEDGEAPLFRLALTYAGYVMQVRAGMTLNYTSGQQDKPLHLPADESASARYGVSLSCPARLSFERVSPFPHSVLLGQLQHLVEILRA